MQVIVCRYRIASTRIYIHAVYEPSELMGPHSTIGSFPDGSGWWGRLGTNRLPADLEALPPGLERIVAVREFHKGLYQKSYDIIRQVYPNLVGREDMGEIETVSDSLLPDEQHTVEV